MKTVTRHDRGEIYEDAKITDEGYIRAKAIVTRTGIFLYQNSDGTIRKELRHPEDVWHVDSIASMELIPVTNGHPQERLVTAENSKKLAIGYTGETIKKAGRFILANLVITDYEGVEAVTKLNRKELSLGYTVDLDEKGGEYEGQKYDARQRNIRYNHLAIVDKARAGSEARIALDESDAFEILNEVKEMAKKKIKIDEEEYMVEEPVSEFVEELQDDIKEAQDDIEELKKKIKELEEKLQMTEGERDSAKDKADSFEKKLEKAKISTDSVEFKKAILERIKLFKAAEDTLEKEEISKLDGMSNLEIMTSVVKKCRKSVNLDGKTELYIQAMFDTILDDNVKKVNTDNVTFSNNSINADSQDPEDARKKMMEKNKNLHKKGA